MQEGIVEYLREKYKPVAIILHGSRARGREREHSDWDFIFLYNSNPLVKVGRELYRDQNIEFTSHVLPIDDIRSEFSSKLQSAKVAHEENDEASELLKKANDLYCKGVHWSVEETNNHKLWTQGRIDGMKDSSTHPAMFLKYYSDLYPRIYSYWYQILEHSYSQPVYVAVEEIAEKDPEYYELVDRFANTEVSMREKVEIAEKIRDRLFQ